jgi:hypothetical protein
MKLGPMKPEYRDSFQDIKEDIESGAQRMLAFCRQYLYEGKVIQFQKSNMKRPTQAKIVWAAPGDYCGHMPDIRITNLETLKDRNINMSDIVWDDLDESESKHKYSKGTT